MDRGEWLIPKLYGFKTQCLPIKCESYALSTSFAQWYGLYGLEMKGGHNYYLLTTSLTS